MIAGMFILSGALSKTSLVPKMKEMLMKHSGKGQLIVFAYMLACVVIIQFSMPTALISMFLPFMAAFDEKSKVQPLTPAVSGRGAGPLRQGLLPGAYFVMINGLLEANGATQMIEALDYSKMLLLPSILGLRLHCTDRMEDAPANRIENLSVKASGNGKPLLTEGQEKVVYVIFGLNFLGILFQKYLPFPMYILPIIAVLILTYLNILNLNDIKNFINLDTIFMLAGVIPLGTAMQKTGAGTVVSNFIMTLFGRRPISHADVLLHSTFCGRYFDPVYEQHRLPSRCSYRWPS